MKRALIDTDTVSYFFRNHPSVVSGLEKYLQEHGFVSISVVTYYEILNGLYYKDASKQLQKFEHFVSLNRVHLLSKEIARKSAEIFAELRKNGQTIGHNDVLIAGTAIMNDMVLVTNNSDHFRKIAVLEIDNWKG